MAIATRTGRTNTAAASIHRTLIVASLALSLGPVDLAHAATTWNVPGDGSNTCTLANPSCSTIQAAVNAASLGDTINVAAGSYNENIAIDKALTLNGANAGTPAYAALDSTCTARSAAESEIIGQSGGPIATVTVTADNVTIDGFKILLPPEAGADIEGVYAYKPGGTISGITVKNNVVDGLPAGLAGADPVNCLFVGTPTSGATVRDNYVANCNGPGITSGGDTDVSTSFAVTNNLVCYSTFGIAGYLGTGSTIKGNVIATGGFGIAGQFNNMDIGGTGVGEGNTITGMASPSAGAIYVGPSTNPALSARTFGDVQIIGNSLANNKNQLILDAALTVRTSTQPVGAAIDASDMAQIIADNSLDRAAYSTTTAAALRTESLGPLTLVAARSVIQDAIAAASPTDTVNVAPGTYNESPNINKSLTLQSSGGRDVTNINLVQSSGYPYGALQIGGASGPVTVDGFQLTGADGVAPGCGGFPPLAITNVLVHATAGAVTLQNNRFRVGAEGCGSDGNDGYGILTDYSTTLPASIPDLTVQDNLFVPLNVSGTISFYINPGVGDFTFRRNTITGKFDFGGTTEAQNGLVEDNTVDGLGAGGFGLRAASFTSLVWGSAVFQGNVITGTAFGIRIRGANNVTVQCNRLQDNDRGVQVRSYVAFDPSSTAAIHNNSFLDNTVGVENLVAGTVDAENNWWGCVGGPGAGGCDPVSGNVDYDPAATWVPVCVNCDADAQCDDGLACNDTNTASQTETCNLSTNMCVQNPVTCTLGGADPQCNDALCAEPGGCTVEARPDGTACNTGDACAAGVCTGGPLSLVLDTARLRIDTSTRRDNGSVSVRGFVNDGSTGGTLEADLLAGNVSVEVADDGGGFHATVPVTGCKQRRPGAMFRCRSGNITAYFRPRPGPFLYTMGVSRTKLGDGTTGTTLPSGPVHVTLHQSLVHRPDAIFVCTPVGSARLRCREP